MKVRAVAIAVLTAAGLFGCSGSGDVDIGDDKPQNSGSELKDYAGTWEGYAEAYQFRDGTDRVRLTLDMQGNGWLEFGNDAPPLREPNINDYPPGYTDNGIAVSSPGLLLGYKHDVSGGRVSASRLKLQTRVPAEIDAWCGLFTPVEASIGAYFCLPNNGFQRDSETGKCYEGVTERGPEIPCSQLFCITECSCDAASCKFNAWQPIELDGALDEAGKAFTGTVVLDERVTIHLTRAN